MTRSRRLFIRSAAGLLGALALLLATRSPTQGALVPVSITLQSPSVVVIGSNIAVTGHLYRADGLPATGLAVYLYANGTYVRSSHADPAGNIDFTVRSNYTDTAGKLVLEARFPGKGGLASAVASRTVTVRPARITISTVPAVPGIPISVGSAQAVTGSRGAAVVNVNHTGPAGVHPELDQLSDPARRVSFVRWGDNLFALQRTIDVSGDATYVLGLRVAVRMSVGFVDLQGRTVDPASVTRATFTSSRGDEQVLTNFQNAWWEAATVVSLSGGLQASQTLWRLADVEMSGANVVYQGQQSFVPQENGTWTAHVLLFDLTLRVDNALGGGALAGKADLVYPDGTTVSRPIGQDGTLSFSSLPRGSYTVHLHVAGLAPPTPIALSRSQTAGIRVITYLDLVLGAGILLLVLLFLLVVGRRLPVPGLRRARDTAGSPARFLHPARRWTRSVREGLLRVPADLSAIDEGRSRAAIQVVGGATRDAARGVVRRVKETADGRARAPMARSRRDARAAGSDPAGRWCPECHAVGLDASGSCARCGASQSS